MSLPAISPSHADRLEVPSPTFNRPKLGTPRPTANRLPPPSLFQGPPSRNASHIELNFPPATSSNQPDHTQQPRASRVPVASSFSGQSFRNAQSAETAKAAATQNDSDRTDAMWAEMQTTLAEVEVSAMTSSHVFGANHAKALQELRASQLALAQAWAKSEEGEMGDALRGDFDGQSEQVGTLSDSVAASSPSSAKKDQDKKDGAKPAGVRNLEEETERDILLARKRREANDRYFQQVNSGVLDVVSKLEEVASAMRRVERQSREIWNESDGDGGDESVMDSAAEETGTTSVFTNSPVSVRR